MKIIKPYMKIDGFDLDTGIEALRTIEVIGRISHRSEEAMTEESWKRFIPAHVVNHGDWSITEHINVRVQAEVDRGITHELVRHRIGSYTQESTRFVNYDKKMPPSFIYPDPAVECEYCLAGEEPKYADGFWYHLTGDGTSKPGFDPEWTTCRYHGEWLRAINEAETSYKALIREHKWSPQQARSVFPNALASKIAITYNLRTWRHFFLMRTSKEAHPQMRQVSIPLLAEFKQVFPIIFDDVEPNSRQADNLQKGR